MRLEFGREATDLHHHCDVRREGDWLIFTCPKCSDYYRAFNMRTGEMKVQYGTDPAILHHNSYTAPGWDTDSYQPN